MSSDDREAQHVQALDDPTQTEGDPRKSWQARRRPQHRLHEAGKVRRIARNAWPTAKLPTYMLAGAAAGFAIAGPAGAGAGALGIAGRMTRTKGAAAAIRGRTHATGAEVSAQGGQESARQALWRNAKMRAFVFTGATAGFTIAGPAGAVVGSVAAPLVIAATKGIAHAVKQQFHARREAQRRARTPGTPTSHRQSAQLGRHQGLAGHSAARQSAQHREGSRSDTRTGDRGSRQGREGR